MESCQAEKVGTLNALSQSDGSLVILQTELPKTTQHSSRMRTACLSTVRVSVATTRCQSPGLMSGGGEV